MGLSALAVPRETSPGKNVYCPSIYRVYLRDARLTVLGFVLCGELAPRAPPRDEHPCLKLWLARSSPIWDFHSKAHAHAERTT